jgi:hypothetical protein
MFVLSVCQIGKNQMSANVQYVLIFFTLIAKNFILKLSAVKYLRGCHYGMRMRRQQAEKINCTRTVRYKIADGFFARYAIFDTIKNKKDLKED